MGFSISKEFPSRFLSGEEIGAKAVNVTIREIKQELAYSPKTQQKEKVLVAYFEGKDRGIRLGKERAMELRTILKSDDTDQWQGKNVCIYTEKKFAFGKNNDVLHFREAIDEKALSKELDQLSLQS